MVGGGQEVRTQSTQAVPFTGVLGFYSKGHRRQGTGAGKGLRCERVNEASLALSRAHLWTLFMA